METILLVILIIVAVAMIGIILLQRSEGGALGIGGGGGPGAMFSARGSANFLTRVTAGLATIFIVLSLVLAILGRGTEKNVSVMDDPGNVLDDDSKLLDGFDSEDFDPGITKELEVNKSKSPESLGEPNEK